MWTLHSFFPPEFSHHYLLALVGPILDSLGMAAGAMLVAFGASLPIGLYIGSRGPGTAALQAALSSIRAIPDLTLAIFCVIVFGIGPAAGVVALAIFHAAALAKIFGDLFLTAEPAPMAALRATGASAIQVAALGLLPLRLRDLITYCSCEFECAIRASVIVGAVGGGGLGTELVGTLASFDFRRTTTLILVLVFVAAIIDRLTVRMRRSTVWALALLPPAAYALWHFSPTGLSFAHALRTVGTMIPPALDAVAWSRLPRLLAETGAMALLGTVLGCAAALPLALLSARNLALPMVAFPVRRILEVLRAVPEVVWALLLVAMAGIGPVSGILALGLHSTGCLGRLFAESFENVPRGPVQAVTSTGASSVAVAAYAALPLALNPIAVHTLFRLEWNLRQATVVGMIGAGGIGQALFEAQQLFFYHKMMAYLAITWVFVLIVDQASAWTRRRFDGTPAPGGGPSPKDILTPRGI